MQEHFSSEHGLVEDLSAARRKRVKALAAGENTDSRSKNAYGGGGGGRGRHASHASRSPARHEAGSPLREGYGSSSPTWDAPGKGAPGAVDGGGGGGGRSSRDDAEIALVQRALREQAALSHAQGMLVGHADGVHVSRMGGRGSAELGRSPPFAERSSSPPTNRQDDLSFHEHVDGKGVGGWREGSDGAEVLRTSGEAGKTSPLRQILPAYLKAVGGGKGRGGEGGNGGGKPPKLAKAAARGSFARAAANEYQGRVGLRGYEHRDRASEGLGHAGKARRKAKQADFGVEDLIARTWAAPEFDDPGDEDRDSSMLGAFGGGRVHAWREGETRADVRGRERTRSAHDDEYGLPIHPLTLDTMVALPSGRVHRSSKDAGPCRSASVFVLPCYHRGQRRSSLMLICSFMVFFV